MKKIYFFIMTCIVSSQWILAQEPADALRYSWTVPAGTARQQAIGGAMSSLGGDISATYSNPAGIGFYKTGDLVLTPAFNFLNNKSTYLGRTEKNNRNNFSFGTTGIVMGWQGNRGRSHAFSLAINRTGNFNSNILYRGENNQNSYSQKFLEEIKNNKVSDPNTVASNFPFGTSLAFNTFWIDTIAGGSGNNYQFQTRAPIATGLLQENSITNKGGVTEFALAGATNYNDKFYIGGTIGLPILRYEKNAVFTEADATTNTGNKFDFATFTDRLVTKGVGINLKVGIIYKPVESLRLGLALHSPTLFSLTDQYNASVTTNTEGYQGTQTQTSEFVSGTGAPSQFKYQLITPYRIIASAAYVLRETEDVKKQKGFLTADIEYVNYKSSSFQPDAQNGNDQKTNDYLKSLNKAIDNAYKGTFNFRLGGELKFTTIMVRAGAAYYGNPYKNIAGEKGNRLLLSGGLGYRNKGIFVDLSYVHNIIKDVHAPYRLESTPYSIANIKGMGGNVVLTVGFKI